MPGAAIKTIAVHFPTATLVDRLLDAAIPLAQAHGATLIGVHVVPAVIVYADATVSMSTEFIVAQQEVFREDAKAVETAFQARVEGAGIAYEWQNADTGDEPTMRAAATLCNVADLVVATQYQDTIPAASGYTPDELVLGTGRPVPDRSEQRCACRDRQARAGRLEWIARSLACSLRLPPAASARCGDPTADSRQPARRFHVKGSRPRAFAPWSEDPPADSLEG